MAHQRAKHRALGAHVERWLNCIKGQRREAPVPTGRARATSGSAPRDPCWPTLTAAAVAVNVFALLPTCGTVSGGAHAGTILTAALVVAPGLPP